MRYGLVILAGLLVSLAPLAVEGAPQGKAARPAPRPEPTRTVVYKTVGDVELRMHLFTPDGHRPGDKRAAAVFFFGGGWMGGSPRQFYPQCEYLASRGMVAMAAEYRVLLRHGTKAVKCVTDAKSAVRWVRAHAEELGVDPGRIAAGGGSAGGHIAGCTGTIEGLEEPGENTSISSVPNAMVLFNPALVLAPVADKQPFDPKRLEALQERMGVDPVAISPYHHVKKGAPPTIIFHGKADTTVPFRTAELFAEAMTKAGNRCKLIGYDDQPHGFFNHGRGGNTAFVETVRAMDEFFIDLGYLEGKPTISCRTIRRTIG